MKNNYQEWISINFPTPQSARKMCSEATEKMIDEFPELVRVRGLAHVKEPYGLPPTRTPHWWCKDKHGNIIDPTSHQYPTSILKYEPVDNSKGEPSGKCPNCGNLCYEGSYICSDACEKEYIDYVNGHTE